MPSGVDENIIVSPLNYTGGKAKLLAQIKPLFPQKIPVLLDLFCGGCNVGINSNANLVIYNDVSSELIGLYKMFISLKPETIIKRIDKLIDKYGFSRTELYSFAYYGGDNEKGVSVYNRSKYLSLRDDFNSLKKKNNDYYIMLYTLILFGFNNQIRFNAKGEYNLPVGKRDFNRVIREKLLCFLRAVQNQNCVFWNRDFRKIKLEKLEKGTFIYADPPYLISMATYNEKNSWTEEDELDLLDYLKNADDMGYKFALSNVLQHKGMKNHILIKWIDENGYYVHHLNKNYSNSNYQLKERKSYTDEVLVTNY